MSMASVLSSAQSLYDETFDTAADTPSSAATSVYTPSPMGDSDYIPSAESTRYITDNVVLQLFCYARPFCC